MNKQMEMGKTMFEVMKMRKNNKQNPFPVSYTHLDVYKRQNWNHGVMNI